MTPARLVVVASLLASCAGGGEPETSTLQDAQLLAFVDDDGDGMAFNDEPRLIRFSDYLARKRPGTKILMLNAAAGWCGPCMHEASKLSELAAAYLPRGVAILTAVFQKPDATPADLSFTRSWAETFRLPIPTLADSMFVTRRYFDATALPANLFVDAVTEEVLTVATGARPGDDPMKEYRELLDHHLARP
jgi:thiol-disulfide isomerase/thioredoxin